MFTIRYQGIIFLNNKFLKDANLGEVTRHFGGNPSKFHPYHCSLENPLLCYQLSTGGTPYNGLYRGGGYLFNTGRLRPKVIPYSGFRLAIAVVEVHKRKVGKLVISVCIKAGLTDAFYGYEKVKKNLVI